MRRKAFTLIEIVIVMTIVGIIASSAIVAYQNIIQQAHFNRIMNDIKTFESTMQIIWTKNGRMPNYGIQSAANWFSRPLSSGYAYPPNFAEYLYMLAATVDDYTIYVDTDAQYNHLAEYGYQKQPGNPAVRWFIVSRSNRLGSKFDKFLTSRGIPHTY